MDALSKQLINKQTLEIIKERIQHHIDNPPNMVCINVVLNNTSALEYVICKEIIMHGANITEADADWYLVMKGIESELSKLTTLGIVGKPDAQS